MSFLLLTVRYVNGDIEEFTDDPKALIDDLVSIHETRRLKYIRRIVFDFQDFLRYLFFNVRPCSIVVQPTTLRGLAVPMVIHNR